MERVGNPVAQPRPRPWMKDCGTDSAYYRHRRKFNEPACLPCVDAHAAAERRRWRAARDRKLAQEAAA